MLRNARTLFLLILILGSCRPSPWIYQSVCSDFPQFNSSQITYLSKDPFQEIEVQILNGHFGKIVFFNALCGELKSDLFTLKIQERHYQYRGMMMEGNQRLMLPLEAAEQLLSAIFKGYEVFASMDHYYANLSPIINFKFFKKKHSLL